MGPQQLEQVRLGLPCGQFSALVEERVEALAVRIARQWVALQRRLAGCGQVDRGLALADHLLL